jgi:hypothetical protein
VTITIDADSLSGMNHAGFITEGEDKFSRILRGKDALSPGLLLCICNLNIDISSQEKHYNIPKTLQIHDISSLSKVCFGHLGKDRQSG